MLMQEDRYKVGQRIVAGFPGPSMSEEFIDLVRRYKVGNVILFRANVVDRQQLRQLCQDIQDLVRKETGAPAFITIDQEGGMVTRLSEDCANVPGAMALSAAGEGDSVYQAGRITGRQLRALGVNFDLAPDMDVNSNAANPVIGVRSYSDDPARVGALGVQMMRGLLDEGVLCCAKHFPGHGDTDVDSHMGLPRVDKSLEELERTELVSFRAAIDAGIPGIMSSHILFPQLEPDGLPATMSRRIMTGLLKERLGFKGLVVSDCMQMQAIQKFYGTVNGVVQATKAGVDLVFVSHDAALAGQAAQALLEELQSGAFPREEMDASVEKILAFKERYALHPLPLEECGTEEQQRFVRRMLERSMTLVQSPETGLPALGDAPLFVGCRAFRPTEASNSEDASFSFPETMATRFGGHALVTTPDPTEEEIRQALALAGESSCLVVGSYNGHLKPGQKALSKALAETGLPMIQVALRNPYDLQGLPAHVAALAAYEYTPQSLDVIAGVLGGEIQPTGKLPVRL